jgi:hypothetical protein
MKRSICHFLAACLLLCLASCSSHGDEEVKPDKTIVVDAKKALTGSFVDFWGKENWSQQEWEIQFKEMKEIGMNTAIIQFVSYGDKTYFNSANTFATTKFPNALAHLLAAANTQEISVYIGLYFSDEYWNNQTNAEWLKVNADRCITIATEINAQFGKDAAFKGWYIPHEPEPDAYNSPELISVFRENLVDRISDKLHSFDSKPVSIAAFFNSGLTTPAQLKDFMKELCRCNLQVIMLQDGVGVNHVSLSRVGTYYNEADTGLYENTGYTGEFWTDLETFSEPPQGAVTIDRIKSQVEAEMPVPHISKAVSYQYYSDMCPTGPGGSEAGWLRFYYLDFIKGLQ